MSETASDKKKTSATAKLKALFDSGYPVSKANFFNAVNNSEGVPENYFSDNSDAKSRRVKMSLTPIGLMCHHKEKYFLVGGSNVVFLNLHSE